jgi:hypothetical protein
MSPKESHAFQVYAGNHQFYLEDAAAAAAAAQLPDYQDAVRDLWKPGDSANMLSVIPGKVAVGTGSYDEVRVTIELYDARPAEDFDGWDHVTEASLDLASGKLAVYGCPDPDPVGAIDLAPGVYRLRIHHGNLDASEIGPGTGGGGDEALGEGGAPDYYRVDVWPEAAGPSAVLKRWAAHPENQQG